LVRLKTSSLLNNLPDCMSTSDLSARLVSFSRKTGFRLVFCKIVRMAFSTLTSVSCSIICCNSVFRSTVLIVELISAVKITISENFWFAFVRTGGQCTDRRESPEGSERVGDHPEKLLNERDFPSKNHDQPERDPQHLCV
jgi:hypothetical protein